MTRLARMLGAVLAAAVVVSEVRADDHDAKAAKMATRAITWLKAQQDAKSGGWGVAPEGPVYPAMSGLVINGLLMEPGIDAKDPAVKAGVDFMLKYRQPDGGIYDKILPSYNTAIVLSALAKVDTPEAKAAIKPAQEFLKSLQFGEGATTEGAFAGETGRVGKDHPYYGGIGYGRSGRPDLSNTAFFIQALHDSGVSGDDPAMQRALVFLARTQMIEKGADGKPINDMPYAKGSKQGGFIYSTSENKDKQGIGQTYGGSLEETMDDGTKVSRLRAYGSMTYAGFKSLIYAQLPPTDERVKAVTQWIRENYTLKENPNVGTDGLYYYFLTFARAMHARGQDTIDVVSLKPGEGSPTQVRDWRHDLIDRLAELQNDDGSFKPVDDRWMESNPVLITAYSLLALQHARGQH